MCIRDARCTSPVEQGPRIRPRVGALEARRHAAPHRARAGRRWSGLQGGDWLADPRGVELEPHGCEVLILAIVRYTPIARSRASDTRPIAISCAKPTLPLIHISEPTDP